LILKKIKTQILPEMTFSKKEIIFLYQNSASIGRLFNVQEQKDFLMQFVTKNEIEKLFKADERNSDHVEKIISFIQLERHNRLYEALVDRLVQIHVENKQFVNDMLQKCERDVDDTKDDTMIVTHKYKIEKELMNSMHEILYDMKIIFDESQSLKIFEKNDREILRQNVSLKQEVIKLNAEIKHLNDE
jgi:hypothetical protein